MNIKSTYFIGDIVSVNKFATEFANEGNEIISYSLVRLEPRFEHPQDFVFFCYYKSNEKINSLVTKNMDKSKLSEFVDRMDNLFEKNLQKKTGWGRIELLRLYRDCVNQILLEIAR